MNSPVHTAERAARARFTMAEFVAIEQSGALGDSRLELVDGEIERMSPAMGTQFGYQGDVFGALLQAFGRRAVVEAGIQIGVDTMLACDVALLHAPMRDRRFLAPDEVLLTVEIADATLDRDLDVKRRRYAQAGIAHYWVVDVRRAIIHSFGKPTDGNYDVLAIVQFGKPLVVPGSDVTITLT